MNDAHRVRYQARQDAREGSPDDYCPYTNPEARAFYRAEQHQLYMEYCEAEPMGLLAKDNAPAFELPPAANHIAVCYMVVDLGMHDEEYNGEIKRKHKVRISWELSQELMSDGRPFSIPKKYTLGLTNTGNLLPDLESWRGRAFTPEELLGFDLQNLLGVPCLLNVIHKNSEDTKKPYAVVSSIAPLPRGTPKPALYNKPLFFSLSDPDAIQKYNAMEPWLQKLINIDPLRARMPVGSPENPASAYKPDPLDDLDDDIPF